MTFPLYYVLFPYWLFIFIFLIMALIDIYHLVRFSSISFGSFVATFVFLAGTTYIFYWTFVMLLPIDFKQIITTFKDISISPPMY